MTESLTERLRQRAASQTAEAETILKAELSKLSSGIRQQLTGELARIQSDITATSLRGRPVEQKSEIVRQVAERVWPLITARVIQLAPETRFSLRDAAAAHEILASGSNVGKLILTLE